MGNFDNGRGCLNSVYTIKIIPLPLCEICGREIGTGAGFS